MAVKFENNIMQVQGMLYEKAIEFLYGAGGELQAKVMRNGYTRVDTGQLKRSWKYIVDEESLKVIVGSPLENSLWEEFGTGEYALNGNGRKTPWTYIDYKGKGHTTTGKRPSRALHRACIDSKPTIQKLFEDKMKEASE